MDRMDDVLSSVHKSVQLIESNTKASISITNKVHELIRLTEVENNCDKHSSGQHNAESNIISNCDPVHSRYSNPHKQASAPVCSVVDTSATTADIFTDGASTTVNRFIHGIQGVQGVQCGQSCTSKSAPIHGEMFTSTVPPVFQQIRPTRWESQTNIDNDTPLRTAVAL